MREIGVKYSFKAIMKYSALHCF